MNNLSIPDIKDESAKKLIFLTLMMSVFIGIIFLIIWINLFLTGYTRYKVVYTSHLINKIESNLSPFEFRSSLIDKNYHQLKCEYRLRKLDDCYATILVQSYPEDVLKNKAAIERVILGSDKVNSQKNNQFNLIVEFTYKDKSLFTAYIN